mmetsp:Transcript_11955/g.14935  ORF Transcript_11955/g.14935 Transcript_11955/m.14935 type:complete len:472 (-) Transcript_11955:205-1620(-)|eukprot:CAMPEP_0172495116 /NCGR_PEP_ID=MMETSP1066-20121228/64150_1 /TAXON_ID=671091 /ORGANISM="Coscinodiscus wailesii, Strain CCMP2513" /LENGTH=471 /DNA_ID=CAMNT_0013266589 /DNA_START=512 /DNA_END=1927 /DNA_ORIENTATION=+
MSGNQRKDETNVRGYFVEGSQGGMDDIEDTSSPPPSSVSNPHPNIIPSPSASTPHGIQKDDMPVSGSTTQIAIKMLVSNNVAGSIIGRAGQSIAELQNQSKCRVKLSQANDCFPGTSDRVCLLQGEMSNILYAIRLILGKFRSSQPHSESQDRETIDNPTVTARILVPSAACGSLIGRGGCHIKSLAEKSHARIQLAQKEEMASVATSERVVTMSGDIRSVLSCVTMVLEGAVQNPELYKYSNMTTSYTKAVAASAFNQAAVALAGAAGLMNNTGTGSSGRGGTGDGYSTKKTYGEDTVSSSPTTGIHRSVGTAPMAAQPYLMDYPDESTSSPAAAADSTSSQPQKTSKDSIQVTVPDSMVGGILGRGGSAIAEIQVCSNTKIKVSERGDFVPGTTNRIVTITGSSQACATAHFLISQRMASQAMGTDLGQGAMGGSKRRRGRRGRSGSGAKEGSGEGAGNGTGEGDDVED